MTEAPLTLSYLGVSKDRQSPGVLIGITECRDDGCETSQSNIH